MYATFSTLVSLILLFIGIGDVAAADIHKCVSDGKVTYQSAPCPNGTPSQRPTVDQLNRERLQRLQAASAAGATAPAPATRTPPSTAAVPTVAPASSVGPYRCDGRTRCTQMRSCPEAKFFLANCPGVQMDGDHDGIPCEEQWCH